MENYEARLQEMFEIGRCLGPGPLFLLYYYDQLTVTNIVGLICWPEGPKVILAVLKPQECVSGFSLQKMKYLLAKIRSLEMSEQDECRLKGL